MKTKAVAISLTLFLLLSACLACVLALSDHYATQFSKTEGSAVLNIETYIDGENQPTHPSVIDMKQTWNGYRYWMAYSPYPNADGAEENPCVCVSNDMLHWVTPSGLYNPIAFNEETACDELKDPHIVYNGDLDRMEIWYLGRVDSTISEGGKLFLFRKTSSDGIHWSDYEIVRGMDGYLSPSIIYSDGKYQLWAIVASSSSTAGAVAYSESADGRSWSSFEKCSFNGSDEIDAIWHGAVSCDDKYRFVYIASSSKSDTIYYTESDDGIVWQQSNAIVEKESFWDGYYRPCILYSDDSFYCIYGVITQENEWYLSMSLGDSLDALQGVTLQDVGSSVENASIASSHTLISLVKNIYHFICSFLRPELFLLCVGVAIILLIIRKSSLAALWGISWLLCLLRFTAQLNYLTLCELLFLVFTTGFVSLLSSLALQMLIHLHQTHKKSKG